MQQLQKEIIQMTPVVCNKASHLGENIRGLCLSTSCKENSAVCFKCPNAHRSMQIELQELEGIPKMLMGLQQLYMDVVDLQDKVNKQFNQLLSTIEQILKPNFKYQDAPNLTNLNEIGSLIKGLPKERISESIDQTKTRIQSLLFNKNLTQNDLVKDSQGKDADYWYQKGDELYVQTCGLQKVPPTQPISFNCDPIKRKQIEQRNREIEQQRMDQDKKEAKLYTEAIQCYDMAISLNPKHLDALYYKGYSLYLIKKYVESIPCFDQVIQINPKYSDAWYRKGEALCELKKYNESIPCYDQAILLDPNDDIYKIGKERALEQLQKQQK